MLACHFFADGKEFLFVKGAPEGGLICRLTFRFLPWTGVPLDFSFGGKPALRG